MSDKDQLVYLPLGGAGEIGMNLYLYGFGPEKDRKWIITDCGVSFGDMTSAPGVDLVLPDIDFIAERRKNLLGIFITHAHEDHVGALGRYWRRLKAPVYCTKFTAAIAARKLEESGLPHKHIHTVAPHERIKLGPFDCSFFPITHSIPEAMSLVIRTPLGTVYHSGDFKLDPAPGIGEATDEAAIAKIGAEGVLCLACDSTNVFEQGSTGSERDVRADLAKIMQEAEGAVAATTFASNVARLKTLAEVAHENDRSVVLAGRAMFRMIEAAVETGVIKDFPPVLSDDKARDMPSRHLFYLVTGSQGENRAAMARISGGSHPYISLGSGDVVIYSSRMIPGNEREILKIYNRLSERGVRVIDDDMMKIHVSGHAKRDEIKRLYELLKPEISLPIHGEHRHLVEHARMAPEWGAGRSIVAPNGSMVLLAGPGGSAPEIVDEVDSGRVYLDGSTFVGALDGVMRSRLRLARQGHVAIALVVDEDGELLADAQVRLIGAPEDGDGWPAPLDEMVAEAVEEAVEGMKSKDRGSDERIEEVAKLAARRLCERYWGKKPEVSSIVTRLEEVEDEDES